MKKIILSSIAVILMALATNAQETATSEGKKLYVGIGGSYYLSHDQHLGGKLGAEYFFSDKLSLELSYNFGYSQNKLRQVNRIFPASNSGEVVGTQTFYNYIHIINLMPIYYIIGGSSADLGIFAGVGPSVNYTRSSEFAPGNRMGEWYGLYLNALAGVDYAVGPGKAFISVGYNQKLWQFKSDEDKTIFENIFLVNLGYKIGF